MSQELSKYDKRQKNKIFNSLTASTFAQACEQLLNHPVKSAVMREIFEFNTYDHSLIDDAIAEFFSYITIREAKEPFFLQVYNSYYFRYWLVQYASKQLKSKTSPFYNKYKGRKHSLTLNYEDATTITNDAHTITLIEKILSQPEEQEEININELYPTKDHLIHEIKDIILNELSDRYPLELKYMFIAFYCDIEADPKDLNILQFSRETNISYRTLYDLTKNIRNEIKQILIDRWNNN